MSAMWWKHVARLGAVGLVAASCALAQAQGPAPRFIELTASPSGGLQVVRESQFWIGVFCRPVDDALRAQLTLPENQGLVVDEVAPGGPAAKAGLQRYDILLSAGDQPLNEAQDVFQAVEDAAGKEVSLQIVRGGAKQTLTITPDERPDAEPGRGFRVERPNVDALRMWVERLGDEGQGPLNIRGFGPGVMLGQRALPQLPEGVSIQIVKTGNEPAEVKVQRGDDMWELTDTPEELQKLPDDLRPAVEQMLGRGKAEFNVQLPTAEDRVLGPRDIDQRLREVESRLEKLLQELHPPRPDQK